MIRNVYSKKILIVDDEEDLAESLKDVLELSESNNSPEARLEIDLAFSGSEAIELVKESVQSGEQYTTILLDIRMPEIDGIEAGTKIRSIDPKAELIFMTGYTDVLPSTFIPVVGQDITYLKKPMNIDVLKQAIDKSIIIWNQIARHEKISDSLQKIEYSCKSITELCTEITKIFCAEFPMEIVFFKDANGKELSDEFPDNPKIRFRKIEDRLKSELTAHVAQVEENKLFSFKDIRICKYENFSFGFSPIDILKAYGDFRMLTLYFFNEVNRLIGRYSMNEKISNMERLSNLGMAIGEVAHDLRSPLTTIRNGVHLVPIMTKDGDDISEVMDLIELGFLDIENYINDLMEFTKGKAIKSQKFRLQSLFDEIKKPLSLIQKFLNVEILFSNEAPDFEMVGDKLKLKRCFFNIINNAMEALGKAQVENPQIQLKASLKDDNLLVTIEDNGNGIPEKVLPHIFDAFSTHEKQGGNGLGCAISKKVVEAHHGSICVRNKASGGALFEISIPFGMENKSSTLKSA